MSSEPEAPPTVPRKRRWLRNTLWVLLGLTVLAVIFHRPILVAVIRWGGAKVAASQGLDLEWEVEGSVLNDLTISSLKTTPGRENHWLPRAELERFSVDYDLGALMRRDLEKAIESVTLHDGDLELDLRHLPKKTTTDPRPEKRKATPLIWPPVIDMKDVDLKVTLTNGKQLTIRGMTMQAGEGMPGTLKFDELRLEPDGLTLGPLQAGVDWKSRKATFKNLVLPQNVVIDELAVDLTQWETGALTARANGQFGEAPMEVNIAASGLKGAAQEVDAQVQMSQLRAAELHALGLPKNIEFDGGELSLQLTGNPKAAASLKGGVQVRGSNVRAAGALLDQVELDLEVDQGTAVLKSARAIRTGNTVEATGQAALPSDLANWRAIEWQAKVNASLTSIVDLLEKPPPVSGNFVINADAKGIGATPTTVTGEIQAEAASFQSYKAPQLRTTLALDGRQARIEVPDLELGAGNTVSLSATMLLEEAMPVTVEWKAAVIDPPALFATTGLKPPPQPLQGSLQTQGSAELSVKDLRAGDFANATADLTLQAAALKYGEGRIQSVDLRASVANGKLSFQPLTVQVDDQNDLRVEGAMGLEQPHTFQAKGAVNLAKVTALNSLLTTFNAPPMESGAVFGNAAATGELRPWRSTGSLSFTATEVRTAKMPEAVDAVVEAAFEGTRADLGKFEAKLGPWRVSAVGQVDQSRADLSELKVWQEQTLLVEGRAKLPFDILKASTGPPMDVAITARDLRVDSILKAAGIDNIPAGVLNADIQLRGRGAGANGKAHVEIRDIEIPKRPAAFRDASAVLDLTLENQRAKVLLTANQPPLQTITLTADVPVNLAEMVKAPDRFRQIPLSAHLEMPETDLSFVRQFAPDLIRSVPARGRISADVSGTVADPQIDATVDISAPQVIWTKLDLPSVRDLRVRITATDRTVRVEDASVILAGGRVRVGGTIDAADLKQPVVDLVVEAREALVYRNPTTSLRADGNLTCRGTLASAHVAGQIDLVRGRLFKEIDFLPSLSLPSDVPPLPPDTARRNTQLVLPAFFADWTFDIRARTRDQFLIAGNVANGAISGSVALTGTGAAPIVSGSANVDRMLLRLPYSVIKVTQGDITIDPASPLDPALDIRAESRVGSTDVTIFVYGNSSDPKTRFTSIPPMPEADVVALLATGTSINGSSNEVAADAAGRAIFLFVKELYRKVRNKPKVLDDEPPRMTISVSPSAAERSDDNIQVSYELTDNWRVTGRFGQSGRVRGFLEYLLRFGKAARAVEEKPNLARIAPNAER